MVPAGIQREGLHRMEEFLLRIRDRLVRVLIDDVRGAEGSVPTLICREAPFAEILPHATSAPPAAPPGSIHFPSWPHALRAEIRADAAAVSELTIDLSQLPTGIVPFALDDFSRQVSSEVESGTTTLKLDTSLAEAWGCQLTGLEQ